MTMRRFISTSTEERTEPCALISAQDLAILVEPEADSDERGIRNLCLGISASGYFTVLGNVLTFPDLFSEAQSASVEWIFLVVGLTATLTATVLAIFYHIRMSRVSARVSHRQDLIDRLKRELAAKNEGRELAIASRGHSRTPSPANDSSWAAIIKRLDECAARKKRAQGRLGGHRGSSSNSPTPLHGGETEEDKTQNLASHLSVTQPSPHETRAEA